MDRVTASCIRDQVMQSIRSPCDHIADGEGNVGLVPVIPLDDAQLTLFSELLS